MSPIANARTFDILPMLEYYHFTARDDRVSYVPGNI